MNYTTCLPAMLLGAALTLTGCGGGSSSGSGSKSPPGDGSAHATLSGVAAVGAPVTGATVTAICSDGSGFTNSVTTATNGSWSGTIDSNAPPCMLQVSGGNPPVTLYSYAALAGTVNITPLTDLVLAHALNSSHGQSNSAFFAAPADWSDASTQLPASISAVLDAFVDSGFSLPPGPPGSFNPFTTVFTATAGNPYDDLLEDIANAIENDPSLNNLADLIASFIAGGSLPAAPGDDGGDGENPEDELGLLTGYAGTYNVTCTAVTPDRGTATRDHARGTVIINSDGSIDYDTDIQLSADDIQALYDRTTIAGDGRRIHINYGVDDSGERIEIYLNDSLEVTEIRHQDGLGERTRAAIGSDQNCDQGPQDDPELGENNGASAIMDGLRKTYTGYVQSMSGFNPNFPSFVFNAKESGLQVAAGLNIQALLDTSGEQTCDMNNVDIGLFVGGTTTSISADSCIINVTQVPEGTGYNPNASVAGTFSAVFTVNGETVTVTGGIFQNN